MAKENNRSSYFGDVVKKFLAHRLAMMGTIVLILEVLAVVFLPSIMKLDPYSMDYMAFGGAPSAEHLLGCDDVGRDLFARLIFGGRVSLMGWHLFRTDQFGHRCSVGTVCRIFQRRSGNRYHEMCRHLHVIP